MVVASQLLGDDKSANDQTFHTDIRPLLSDTCFYCHGPDAAHREADLRLDIEESAKEYAIVPGDLKGSEFWNRISSNDPDVMMPPPDSGKKLNVEQKALLKTWIETGAKYAPFWAYVPPRSQSIPNVSYPSWPLDPIDNFVLAGLERNGLRPAAAADFATLIRRVTFDLTGLPPEPEALREVVTDPSPVSLEKYVDRLLASPAYGERIAAYWLDLVRFADTVGYHGDQDHNISPYRDYVIDALNQNMPLDQFTREQIAGDLLDDPTIEQLVATGYNRLLQTSHEGGVQPKEYLAIYAADRVRNLSAVWMGATIGCAQCHDHKYDPYTAKDFYSLSAFFADVDEAQHFHVGTNVLPTSRPPEMVVSGRKTMVTQSIPPRETRVLPRGNWLDDSGEVVLPSVPRFLPPIEIEGRRANRLDLANWLFDERDGVGGLTARVFVNRFWYLLFGRGLSASLADFGGQGEPPTHPELLDQLAIDFIESGWDVKNLLRRMVLSQTYRQSSSFSEDALRADPLNRWFARQSRYRLPAEMVRDNALASGRLLVHRIGGASVKPWQPDGYYRHLNFPKREYQADEGESLWRRGVYVHWQRQFLHPMMKALDAPSREECTAERPRSNTPLEALVLLNDPVMIQAAKEFAKRLTKAELPTDKTIDLAYEIALSRKPNIDERQTLTKYFLDEYRLNVRHFENASSQSKDQAQLDAWTSVCRVLLNLHETVTRQ